MIPYPAILDQRSSRVWSWNDRDAILYALCLGFGESPHDERARRFVYEKDLRVVPTFPTILAWVAEPTFTQLGIDPITALHGEQRIELHRAIPIPADLVVRGEVVDVFDKGAGRGAVVITRQVICEATNHSPIATLTTTCFARGEGGCGGSHEIPPPLHATPVRPPDRSIDFSTRSDLALLYRLSGDRNLLHADPEAASAAGFSHPILHGLCTFGFTCRAVLEIFGEFEPFSIAVHQARFTASVYPGETLTVDLWRDENIVSFQARVRSRGVTVIKNGLSVLRK